MLHYLHILHWYNFPLYFTLPKQFFFSLQKFQKMEICLIIKRFLQIVAIFTSVKLVKKGYINCTNVSILYRVVQNFTLFTSFYLKNCWPLHVHIDYFLFPKVHSFTTLYTCKMYSPLAAYQLTSDHPVVPKPPLPQTPLPCCSVLFYGLLSLSVQIWPCVSM